MMKFLVPVALALGLTACAGTGVQMGEIDHQAYAAFAVSQVESWNQMGVDPFQLEQDTLRYLVGLCGTVVGALEAGLVVVDGVTADDVLAYCEVAVRAAGPAPEV